jgi:hypothetical protein
MIILILKFQTKFGQVFLSHGYFDIASLVSTSSQMYTEVIRPSSGKLIQKFVLFRVRQNNIDCTICARELHLKT